MNKFKQINNKVIKVRAKQYEGLHQAINVLSLKFVLFDKTC